MSLQKKHNFDENTDLVKEVIDFSNSAGLLDGRVNGGTCIYDFNLALEYANERLYIGDEYTWANLCSRENSKIVKACYERDDVSLLNQKLDIVDDEIDEGIGKYLDEKYDDAFEFILSNMVNCARSRAVQGTKNRFYEKIFAAYKSGGWPCGWEGEWPDGDLVIFYPKK